MLEAVLAGLFGLLIGSFLNVCIYRMPENLSVVRPRSFCPNCKHQIAWFDNIPVLTYLFLRGRCRYCGHSISKRYPLVEALTGALFFLAVWRLGPTGEAARLCVFSALQVGLIFTDIEARILPDEFTLGGILAGIAFSLFVPLPILFAALALGEGASLRMLSVTEAAIGALVPPVILWSVGVLYKAVRRREGLGLGDVKMMSMVGAFLGLHGALLTLLAGSLTGTVVGLTYILVSRKGWTYELPFGSFLGAGAIVVAFMRLAIP